MINKRVKAELKKFNKENYHIKFCLGTIALIVGCIVLLIIATFTQIKINFNIPEHSIGNYLKFEYIPQIPIVLFIAAILGECWGLIAILFYVIMGLIPIFPIFALGGGMPYIFQYNFGYIFSFIFACIIVAKELKGKTYFINIIKAVFYGVLIIHLIGIVYMSIIAILRHDSIEFIKNWIYYQSISKLLYDIVFGFIAIILAKGIRKVLWLIMG